MVRAALGVSVAHMISKYVSQIKGSGYEIDDRIDLGYLSQVVGVRGIMKIRGYIRFFRRGTYPFIGSNSCIRSSRNLTFGSGVTFAARSYVDALSTDGVVLGDNCSVGRNTRIECTGNLQTLGKGMTVGDNVGLGTDCLYGAAGGIVIGDDTIVGNFVTFHSENHKVSDLSIPIRLQGVSHQGISVGRDCWIGAKSTILDGVHIGDGCVIAAGSVVVAGHYLDHKIYGGVPAKWISSRD